MCLSANYKAVACKEFCSEFRNMEPLYLSINMANMWIVFLLPTHFTPHKHAWSLCGSFERFGVKHVDTCMLMMMETCKAHFP
jgi:hypothetical protein